MTRHSSTSESVGVDVKGSWTSWSQVKEKGVVLSDTKTTSTYRDEMVTRRTPPES